MAKRIYVVVSRDGETTLVRAGTPAAAIKHVVSGNYGAEVASQETLVELLSRGAVVEDAGPADTDTVDALPEAQEA